MTEETLQADIIISDIWTKDGKRKNGGAYHLTKWTDQNGIQYGTFDASARSVTKGSHVQFSYESTDAGNDITDDGWTVINAATAAEAAATPPPPSNGKSAWEHDEALSRQDRLDQEHGKNVWIARESLAATVFRHVADLKAADKAIPDDVQGLYENITRWGRGLFPDDMVAGVPRDVAEAIGKLGGPAKPDDAKQSALDEADKITGDTRTQADKDFDALESAGSNGIDQDWFMISMATLKFTVVTLHTYLKSQGLPPVEGETLEAICQNIPHDRAKLVVSAIESRLAAAKPA